VNNLSKQNGRKLNSQPLESQANALTITPAGHTERRGAKKFDVFARHAFEQSSLWTRYRHSPLSRLNSETVLIRRPFVKRFRPMLSDRCLSVRPVCDVCVLRPKCLG